jgi:nucleotide-binding universal stress UspA family protein
MKTILAPTDFSKVSKNAVDYAAEIAKRTKATLILFHAYLPPVMVSDVPTMIPLTNDLEKKGLRALRRIATNLNLKHGKMLKIEVVCKYGAAVSSINDIAKERKADLIVIGLQGAGLLEEKLVGSITTDLIKKSEIPVLSIGKNVKFKNIKSIAFATDFLRLSNESVLDPLKEMAGVFKAHIYIFHVIHEDSVIPTVTEAVQGVKLDHALKGYDHSFHACINKKITEGISDFVKAQKIDMVVMIPRKRSILQTVFNKRETKKVAFQSTIPLLTFQA